MLRRFSENGVAILFISHKLEEIRSLTKRATVLRRGRNVGTVDSASKSSKQLAEMMVGSSVGDIDGQARPTSDLIFFSRCAVLIAPGDSFCDPLRGLSLRRAPARFWGLPGLPAMARTS